MESNKINFAVQKNFSPFIIEDLPDIEYVMTSITMPELTLTTDSVPNPQMPFDIPAQIEFGDLSISFIIDEGFENYKAIVDWVLRLGYNEPREKDIKDEWSDGSFTILDNNNNPIYQINFEDCFPISLSGPEFSSQEGEPEIISDVTFKYTAFHIEPVS